jgi:peptidoglycan/LPS O-acetylase OafA/YrhL
MGAHTLGVKIFFVISGYLVSDSWLRDPNIVRFLARRCLRIFPALAMVTLLSALVVGPLLTDRSLAEFFRDQVTWRYLFNIVLYVHYYLPGVFADNPYPSAVNGSLWTLPVEFAAYLACPLMLWCGRSNTTRIIVLGATCGCIALDLWARGLPAERHLIVYATDTVFALQLLVFFLLGTLARVCKLERYLHGHIAVLLILVAACASVYGRYELWSYVVIAYSTLAFGLSPPATFSIGSGKEDYSYGLYLWAFPVQQFWASVFGAGRPFVNFILSAGVALVLAMLSWKLIERPALSLKPLSNT